MRKLTFTAISLLVLIVILNPESKKEKLQQQVSQAQAKVLIDEPQLENEAINQKKVSDLYVEPNPPQLQPQKKSVDGSLEAEPQMISSAQEKALVEAYLKYFEEMSKDPELAVSLNRVMDAMAHNPEFFDHGLEPDEDGAIVVDEDTELFPNMPEDLRSDWDQVIHRMANAQKPPSELDSNSYLEN